MKTRVWVAFSYLLVAAAVTVMAGCASSEPKKRDYPAETVGGPPSGGSTGSRARAASLDEGDFPSDECERIYRNDREGGTRCFHRLFIERIQAGDQSSAAAFWPDARIRIQVTGADGKTEMIELDGVEMGQRLRASLKSGVTSSLIKIAGEEERLRKWEIEALSDGTVRLHQEDREDTGSWKADYYVAMVDDDLKYVRMVVVMYVDSDATLR